MSAGTPFMPWARGILTTMFAIGLFAGPDLPEARGVDLPLNEGTLVHFADVREGAEALTRRDDYIQRLSPFDRQVRLQTDRPVSEQQLLDFVAQHVLPWQDDEIRKLAPLVDELRAKVVHWKLNLPETVLLVKTSGREEGRAAYCRGPAVVIPQNMVNDPPKKLGSLLAHELFHVLSSHNPPLREALYATIGFSRCDEIALPEDLRNRKITNPDAPVNDHFITVEVNGQPAEFMPVLFSKTERYDAARGGGLFSYLEFRLMLLENLEGTRRPVLKDGHAVLVDPKSLPDFSQQIGRNTSYIIHPEEILAENFVLLLAGRIDVPSPRVIEQMGKVLQEFGVGQ